MEYNIFSKLQKEIADFNDKSITIAQPEMEGGVRFLKNKTAGYVFSQKKILNLIDLYWNSKFEKGQYDSEGQRKLFLNEGKFRTDVTKKQTDIDVKNFVFIPDTFDDIRKTDFMSRRFKIWAREQRLGELLNECNGDYCKYGTTVVKKVGKKVIRVPLRSLINTQDAKSLQSAAENGGYVIEEHRYTLSEMKKFKEWDIKDLIADEEDGKVLVYERYALCPETFTRESGDEENMVLTMAILAPNSKEKKLQTTGKVIFKEQAEIQYLEAHYDKQDGRWLGVGVMEDQLENQVAKNFTANMRRRGILWAVKKVLQSSDPTIAKNLVRDVKDGDILEIAPNGQISQVNTQNGALADLNADDAVWDRNSDQKAFTYDVVTGNTPPSGTPFRLGVMLSQATISHFDLKKQQIGFMWKNVFADFLIPIFKKDTKEHIVQILNNSEGSEQLKDSMIDYLTGKTILDNLLEKDILLPTEEVKAEITKKIEGEKFLFFEVMQGYYDSAEYSMELEITGESIDTKSEIETITNILIPALKNPQALQDPTIRRLIAMAVSKTGRSLESILGKLNTAPPPAPAMAGAGQMPIGQMPAMPQSMPMQNKIGQ